ncbi:MAG: hypothetical protein SGPRY_003736, partial [Prymnesium sp.]
KGKARGKAKPASPKKAAGFGSASAGGFRAKQQAEAAVSAVSTAQLEKALAQNEVSRTPDDPQLWLQLGAVCVKGKEYAEAERIFRKGAELFPRDQMLSAAALTLGGDSAAYYHGTPDAREGGGSGGLHIPPSLADEAFTSFSVPEGQMANWDQADRAAGWEKGLSTLLPRGVVHRSNAPLLPPSDCAWLVREVEAHAEVVGWSKARHVQAPTTDIPVSQVPAIREWFDEKLRTVLFPMLAASFAAMDRSDAEIFAMYPEAIASPDELRVMDAFVVRYDAREQASLPMHIDENTFSFTIALNDRSEYEGGGTMFAQVRPLGAEDEPFGPTVLNADAGGVVTFPGKLLHGGNVVTKGRRYIIPLFIYLDANASGKKPGYLLRSMGFDEADGAAALSRYAAQLT